MKLACAQVPMAFKSLDAARPGADSVPALSAGCLYEPMNSFSFN